MTTTRSMVIAGIVIVGAAVAYWLVSPLVITRRVAEELPGASSPTSVPAAAGTTGAASPPAAPAVPVPVELARGTFEGLAGHRAWGTARIIESAGKRYMRFDPDFVITNGPDLFVYLGRNGAYDPNMRLGALKGNEGSQNYELPAGFNLSTHDEVWVWCRAFSVPFGSAELRRSADRSGQ